MLDHYSFVDYFTIPPSFVSIYLDRTWIGNPGQKMALDDVVTLYKLESSVLRLVFMLRRDLSLLQCTYIYSMQSGYMYIRNLMPCPTVPQPKTLHSAPRRPPLSARPPPHDPPGHSAVPQHSQDVDVDPVGADQRHVRLHVAHGRGHHSLGKRNHFIEHCAERSEVLA